MWMGRLTMDAMFERRIARQNGQGPEIPIPEGHRYFVNSRMC